MENLWSPWRAAHIDDLSKDERPDDGLTLFERLLAEDQDEKNFILWRGDHVFVIMNLYPYNNGHLMVVPYRRVSEYDDLREDELMELSLTTQASIRWLRRALNPEGFNVGMNLGAAAGAGVPDHLHMHIVPRWNGDTNFMPAIGRTKVLPEDLPVTYRRLKQAIAAEPGGRS